MSKTIRVERRQRGVFGWVFLILFWVFNAFMAWGLFEGLANTSEVAATATTEAQKAGAAIGTALGVSMVLGIWMAGAAILGLLVLMTRGRKVITETIVD